jgi:osmoprotectant transport system substrate-binding protein
MHSQVRFFVAPLALFMSALFLLSACGSTTNNAGGPGKGATIVIGSKHDADSQLEGEMYILLLQKQGYTITPKLDLGDTNILHNAIVGNSIDLYPEFTGTGLSTLGLQGTSDPQKAYTEAKSGFEQQFHITWLDAAFNLNDDYGLCTSQANATKFNLHNISDLTAVSSQLTLTAQSDAIASKDVVPALLSTYNLHFKKTVQLQESLSFAAVQGGQADINVCYTTDPTIVQDSFVLLKDDKNALPVYNPAPIIRDSVLTAHPDIATTLNALSAKLTSDNITAAIKSFKVDHQPIDVVATQFLTQQGLL